MFNRWVDIKWEWVSPYLYNSRVIRRKCAVEFLVMEVPSIYATFDHTSIQSCKALIKAKKSGLGIL